MIGYNSKNNSEFKDGLFDNSLYNIPCVVCSPNGQFVYRGKFKKGQINGYGEFLAWNHEKKYISIFDGEWIEGIPYKNKENPLDDGIVRIVNFVTGNKVFEGSIKRGTNGCIYGEGSFYYTKNESVCMYSGKYQCPTISSFLLMTPDIEMLEYKGILPKMHSLNCDDYTFD